MKLSKYFLSAFAFVVAVGGAVGSAFDNFDFVVTSGSLGKADNDPTKHVEQVMSLGPNCTASNTGIICLAQTSGGTFVPTYSTAAEAPLEVARQRQP